MGTAAVHGTDAPLELGMAGQAGRVPVLTTCILLLLDVVFEVDDVVLLDAIRQPPRRPQTVTALERQWLQHGTTMTMPNQQPQKKTMPMRCRLWRNLFENGMQHDAYYHHVVQNDCYEARSTGHAMRHCHHIHCVSQGVDQHAP